MIRDRLHAPPVVLRWGARPGQGAFVMSAVLLVLGFFLIYPVLILLVNTFNTAGDLLTGSGEWGLDHWRSAFDDPRILKSLLNTLTIWGLTTGISFPVAVLIAWTLARTRVPFSHGIEFTFWLSYMMPGIATTVAWINLMDPDIGILNYLLERLPFVESGPFNIFSVPGIVWAHLMANGISVKVMLLTPAFRNMDASLEEASRVSGASSLGTMMRVTLPLMISPMVLVFALQMLRIFQTFEIEQLLGIPFDYYVYSTLIFDLVRGTETPSYGQATVLASLTLAIVAVIIPFQRWILQRRHYTTVSSQFRPGLIDLGVWNYIAFAIIGLLLLILTLGPMLILVLGSFMSRVGYFEITPVFTLRHWQAVLSDNLFLGALKTTVTIATTAAILSPLLFSLLAYILVRTRWVGRGALDTIIWGSGAIPGILAGLGLLLVFLDTPGLSILYGTIWALLIVVILQGNTTGTNVMKGVFVQVGAEMEEASRIAGAGWLRTYFEIWLPLLMPTLVLLATMNFVIAANTTSSIILLASRDVVTLSILALELASPGIGAREQAGIVSLLIMAMTAGLALVARAFGLHLGVNTATVVRRRRKSRALLATKADGGGDTGTANVETPIRAVVDSRTVGDEGAMITANSRETLEKRDAVARSTVAVRLEKVAKTYPGGTQAVRDVSFEVKDGELFSLLGASGCGKSTTLRLIAGLEIPDSGAVYLRDQPVAVTEQRLCLPPEKRRVGMVFQSYALWPHMTVEKNVGYPLKVRGVPRSQIRERVRAFLDLVGMRGMEDRPAPLLSGGQQQRVALARALVTEPDVLLLDEPFSSLDAKLRQQMRVEVKLIQKRLSIAVIFVTHDQIEALSISDRVALIDRGIIQQTGTPREVYESPRNEFVRDFIGKTILFRGVVHESHSDGRMALRLEGSGKSEVFGHCYEPEPPRRGDTAYLCVRPEDLEIFSANGTETPAGVLAGVVETALFTGEQVEYRVHVAEQGDFLVYGSRHGAIQEGRPAWLRPRADGHTVWSKGHALGARQDS